MKTWEQVQGVMEIIDEVDNDKHRDFVVDLHEHLDPHNVEEELSERQIDYLDRIHDFWCNGNEKAFEDWDESN